MSQPGSTVSLTEKGWVPIGFVYVQFPSTESLEPGALFSGTWNDISDNFTDSFFRIEGSSGNAVAAVFGSDIQPDNNPYHTHAVTAVGSTSLAHSHAAKASTLNGAHTHTVPNTVTDGVVECDDDNQEQVGEETKTSLLRSFTHIQSYDGVSYGPLYTALNHVHTLSITARGDTHAHTITANLAGSNEFRPVNYTVKVWKRVS